MRSPAELALVLLAGAGAIASSCAAAQNDVTTIEITEKVLVKDCSPFGINLGSDDYYSGAALRKNRSVANFEGSTYRQCHFGPVWKDNGASTWFGVREPWRKILIGGRYTILSGPAKATTGVIRDITTIPHKHRGRMEDRVFFVFDKKVPAAPPNSGLLVERFLLDQGQLGPLDGYWRSKNLRMATGDVPPGSFGTAALHMDARDGRAHIRFATHYQRYGQTNGTWNVHFRAKAVSGGPSLRIACDPREYGGSKTVTPAAMWQKFQVRLAADKVPEPKGPRDNPFLRFLFEAAGGQVLLDDVQIWMDGDRNPTAFRDDCVNMLKTYGPGAVRLHQMGGNTLANTLQPPLRAHAFNSQPGSTPGTYQRQSRTAYSLHQMYELCQHIGAEPWYCLPGTLSRQEMNDFMEYLGGSKDTKFGKLRVELGQPKPWTDVLGRIHVEFGNEAWNNAGPYQLGGFNGPDYWKDLIAAAKKSPYYKPNVLFHAAGQAAWAGRNQGIMRNCPNADRFGVAPYIIHTLNQSDMKILDTDEKFFRWAFAWPIQRSRSKDGAMFQNHQYAKAAGIELSVYEMNHHITHGDAPPAPRNRLVTSIGGGLNVANNMLLMLKEHHVRTQCLFTLVQHGYRAESGVVRLWGTALNMRAGHERYRPTFLACAAANKVMRGHLVATVHRGADPRFSATGVFRGRAEVQTLSDLPVLWSYAFADGPRRGLIVVSLDTSRPRPVAVQFKGKAAGGAPPRRSGFALGAGTARCWRLTAKKITDNNEFEQPTPQVKLTEQKLADFKPGTVVTLPPFSMLVLKWQVG